MPGFGNGIKKQAVYPVVVVWIMPAITFLAGQYSGLRFDETNVHGQCVGCNCFKHGNLIEYGMGIVERYGTTYHIELLNKSKNGKLKKWSRSELEEIIEKYKL